MIDTVITPPLARAARGLLNWQQSDLAKKAGLSLTAVKNFEGGRKRPHTKTTQALQNAFEAQGVEFPLSGGVRQVEDISTVYRFSGTDFIQKMNQDIFAAVRHPHEEILTASISEDLWPEQAKRHYLDWRDRMQVNTKSLIPEGYEGLNLPRKCYRTVPREMLGKITYCIYADRIGFILWKKRQVVVLRNAPVVQTFRNQFLYLWRNGRQVDG